MKKSPYIPLIKILINVVILYIYMKNKSNIFRSELSQSIQLTARLQQNLKKIFKQGKPKLNEEMGTPQQMQYTPNKWDQQSNPQSMHVQEIQLLKDQIQGLKTQIASSKEEIKSCRKYIKFLEGYNDQLKKEVVLWMNRSSKPTETYPTIQITPPYQKVQATLHKFRNNLLPKQQNLSMSFEPFQKESSARLRPLNSAKTNKNEKICTSCNYLTIKDQLKRTESRRKKYRKKQSQHRQKGRSLCECHHKYVEKSYFE